MPSCGVVGAARYTATLEANDPLARVKRGDEDRVLAS
jgi:hypothetical protein